MKFLSNSARRVILKYHYSEQDEILVPSFLSIKLVHPMTPSAETLRIPAFRRKKLLKIKLSNKKTAAKKPGKRLSPRLSKRTVKKIKPLKSRKTFKKIVKAKKVLVKRPAIARTPRQALPRLQPIGMVTHYYDRINVGVLKLSGPLRIGDRLRLKGKKGEFEQAIKSMQVEHQPIEVAAKGADLGLKVDQEVKVDAIAYKIL